MSKITDKQEVLILLSPLEKKIIRDLFYNKSQNDSIIESSLCKAEYQYAKSALISRLGCDGEFELGIWASQNPKLWATKSDLVKLNLDKYYSKSILKRIVITDV
jgi:hypothetical protein